MCQLVFGRIPVSITSVGCLVGWLVVLFIQPNSTTLVSLLVGCIELAISTTFVGWLY